MKDVRSGTRTPDLMHQRRALTDCATVIDCAQFVVKGLVCRIVGEVNHENLVSKKLIRVKFPP